MRKTFATIWHTRGLARYLLLAGVVLSLLFIVMAVFAPWIAPYDFAQNSTEAGQRLPKLARPSGTHWLGTNDQFYDIFSRVVWGARTALEVVLLSVLLSALVGVPMGLASGFLGGWLDRVLVFLMDALYSFPSLLLAIVFSFLLRSAVGGGVLAAALALTAVYIPQYFRVVRNTTVSAREATYVEAARALGAKPFTIMRKYLFGNVVQSVPVIGTLNAADALGTLAALGFLGLGIQPTEAAEWGYDLSRALDDTSAGIWWPALFPGLAIILLITALTLVGEGLNETLNPALRRRRLQQVRFGLAGAGRDDADTDPEGAAR
ncbi:Glutathione transport system permease protein GsiD [Nocardioides dokdonensis FR1436]|uniref:Glutathione transport system permease protein GsiD n=1 Tax=Nocardioides dokdonensis FR1436 TaxID=1300347 RepID=A0A1A9GQ03_9ACTN|nr:ABC transporter permease [Nocardioides dokdonensis]ANH39732.1 Glutathione transport system permease protein GsiD [Nocardioides dokdonensis FR1436]